MGRQVESCRIILRSGKLLGEKTSVNFEVLWLLNFVKVIFAKFGRVASFGGTSKQSMKVFSTKNYFPLIHKSFSLDNFPLYSR